MHKIDLHQDIILSFQSDITSFSHPEKVENIHGTYAGGFQDYQEADLRIVWAANWPYHLEGDLENIAERKITYDRAVFHSQHQAMTHLMKEYGMRAILSQQDLEVDEGLACVHHVEGYDDVQSLADIDLLFDCGVRSLGFVRNFDNSLAHCNITAQGGLTELGKEVVRYMNTKGMVIDTAHMNHQTMMDVLATSTKPILNSHSNLQHYADHTRNVADEFLDALAKNGGVLGLSVYKGFVKSLSSQVTRVDYLDQVAYVIDRIGSEYVALGTDFHGLPTKHCVEGLSCIRDVKLLESEMIARFGADITEQFFWKNVLRVLKSNLPQS